MLLLKKNSFAIHSPARLVKAEEAFAVRRSAEVLADAEAEAARIREAAHEAAAAEKQRGYEQGLEEGKAAIVAKKLELLDESVAFMESVEGKMADIVMTALRKCVAEIGDEALVVQIVKKVMEPVRNRRGRIRRSKSRKRKRWCWSRIQRRNFAVISRRSTG